MSRESRSADKRDGADVAVSGVATFHGRAASHVSSVVGLVALTVLFLSATGFPWTQGLELDRTISRITSGYSTDEALALRTYSCISRALDQIPPGSNVDLATDDLMWFQRTVEIGFPRLRFNDAPFDARVTVYPSAQNGSPVMGPNPVRQCGLVSVEVARVD